jgi:hypothetical protein
MMCKVLHLNRSTVYKIFKHKMSDREIRRLELESKIIEIYNEFDMFMVHQRFEKNSLNKAITLHLSA